MSTALVSAFYDVNDVLFKNNRNASSSSFDQRQKSDRRIVSPLSQLPRRHSTSATRPSTNLITVSQQHKRDRSQSLSVEEERRRGGSTTSSRYKTELCRPFEENGTCKYGDKCQFAHGIHEVRQLSRHPKYKTELCRTFHTIGFCPYGPRCHFIHNADEKRSSSGSRMSPVGSPSPPLAEMEPSSPLPTSLTPPSPSPISFYDDSSPLGSPLPIPMANSPRVNNVFTFPPHARDFSPVSSPTIASSPLPFSPLPEDEKAEENFPPSPPDSLDGFGNRRRLPVFNQLAIE